MTPEETYRAGYKAGMLSMPEIVVCKDCKHSCDYTDIYHDHAYKCTKNGGYHNDSWFCADGKRKEE